MLARTGESRVLPRTQSSLAVSADGDSWLLINASPDLLRQFASTAELHPRLSLRDTPIAAVLVTNGDVDHVAGLLSLRESQSFVLHATGRVLDMLAANPIFDVLSPRFVTRTAVRLGVPFRPMRDLTVTLFPVPGKVPLWLEDGEPEIGEVGEATAGVMIEGGGRRLAYIPGCATVTDEVRARIDGVDVLMFDGTVHEDDDLVRAGVGEKTGRRMGHMPMSGASGSIAALADARIGRRVFVHINNTNPVLVEDSPERREVEQAGWTVAYDGMAITL
jgi:pyrroloquinoline quinone biosynthesis protein B